MYHIILVIHLWIHGMYVCMYILISIIFIPFLVAGTVVLAQCSLPRRIAAHCSLKLATLQDRRRLAQAKCGGWWFFECTVFTPYFVYVSEIQFEQTYFLLCPIIRYPKLRGPVLCRSTPSETSHVGCVYCTIVCNHTLISEKSLCYVHLAGFY
jgi:hypothetical protein